MTNSRGSVWFIALTVVALVPYLLLGVQVIGDVGVSGPEAVHLLCAVAFLGVVVCGLVPQLIAPARNVAAFQQAFVAALGLMGAAAILGDPDNRGGQAGPFDVVYLIFLIPLILLAVLHLARRDLLKPGSVQPVLLLLAAAVAIPLFVYAVDQGLIQRNSWPPRSDPHHNSHWFTMAALGFTIPLVTAVAGLGSPGWWLSAWTASAALAAFGFASALFPNAPSSAGVGWGVLAFLAAAAVAAAALAAGRRHSVQRTMT
jgi:hypothetical protein